ncbi:MAG: hypothetical protein WC438_06035 [Candidatus Pacearchaeota archaeon]
MSKQILIESKYVDGATQGLNKTSTAATNLGKKATAAMKQTSTAVQDTVGQLESLGNRFRYLSLVFTTLSVGAIALTKSFVDAAKEMEASTLKLGVYAVSTGQDMDKAKQAALSLADTGLVSISEASNSLSNLLATGLNLDTAQVLMKRMLDTAVLSKENLTDTFGQALEKSTLGIRILQERQVDAIGINFTAIKVWRDYAKEIGKTTNELSTTEKQMAIVNYLMKETERFSGGADLATQTFTGSLSKLNATVTRLKIVLGETLVPLVGTLSEILTNVSTGIMNFASNNTGLTSALLAGTVALTVFVSTLAMLGALVPMVVRGFQSLSTAGLALMTAAGIKALLVFTAMSVAIGGLIYLVLKATGQWDKWQKTISSLTDRIKQSIKEYTSGGEDVLEIDEKIIKQLKKLQDNMNMTTRDFVEGMKEWVDEHDKTMTDLKDQINDLKDEYTKAVDKIKSDFSSAMDELNLNHARKTEDIQRDLAEEVSKGIWADQTKIRDLELSLKRENEDYAIASAEKLETKEEEITKESTQLTKKLEKLQKELDEELKLENEHAVFIAQARTWPILDEIEKRTRAFTERIAQYQEERQEILESSSSETSALDDVIAKYSELNTQITDTGNVAVSTSDKIANTVESMKKQVDENGSAIEQTGTRVRNAFLNAFGAFATGTVNAFGNLPTSLSGAADMLVPDFISNMFKDFFQGAFAEGGIVPGAITQPVPILAHGGETVLPAGVSPMNININNPTVRSDDDIRKIADAVKDVLSREQMFKKFK